MHSITNYYLCINVKRNKAMIKYSTLLFFTIFFLSVSCKKDDDIIPVVPVDIYIDVNSTIYSDLNSVGGWIYLTGGYKGIIVYRSAVDLFMVYERACPYHPTTGCDRLEVDASGLVMVDSICGSKFIITDGSVINGPAARPAKQYYTNFNGSTLYIYN